MEEAKKDLLEVVDMIRNPRVYEQRGARQRRGALLYGPPGTGKTALVKAVAARAGFSLVAASASEMMEKYQGTGPKRVREMFDQARQSAPCILFIDEIDALNARDSMNTAMSLERNSTINQLLVELDGFEENCGVLVIAATNRVCMLDPAMTRSGRFDLKVQVGLPSKSDREKLLDLFLGKCKESRVDEGVRREIVESSEGFSGADVENMVNEAVYLSLRTEERVVTRETLTAAMKKVKQAIVRDELPIGEKFSGA